MKMDYKSHSLEWWKELYEEKTKDKYDKLNNMFEVYNSSKGFAQYSSTVSKTLFVIYHVCGEADYWQALAKRLALASGKTHLCTLIKRNAARQAILQSATDIGMIGRENWAAKTGAQMYGIYRDWETDRKSVV